MRTTPTAKLAASLAAAALLLAGCSAGGATASNSTSDCTPEHKFSTIVPGKLTVSAVVYPPGMAQEGNDAPTGIDADLVAAIAKRECLTADIKIMDAPGAIGAVQSGRADIAAGEWWRSAAREKVVGQSLPTWTDGLAIISKEGYSTLGEIEKLSVGDTRGNSWNDQASAALGSNYKLYSKLSDLYLDLKAGRVAAALVGTAQGIYTSSGELKGYKVIPMKATPKISVTTAAPQVNLPYMKSNKALGKALDADITALHKDGTIKKIIEKYGLPAESADPGAPRLIEG
jgi:polar amino acid transport system substrate-binding protein